MKSTFGKFLICFLLLFASKQVKSQFIFDNAPWCPSGATWIYKSFSPTSNLFYKFSYEKDTLINTQNAKKIVVNSIQYFGAVPNQGRIENYAGVEFLRESNDSIFWYDFTAQTFKFIYAFNLQLGNSVPIENSRALCVGNANYPSKDTLYVTSLYVDTFGLRIFNVADFSSNKFVLGSVVSKIGSLSNPFPEINRMECNTSQAEYGSFYEGLVCYSDSIRGSVQFSSISNADCFSISTKVENLSTANYGYSIFPNPSTDIVTIIQSEENLLKQISIYSIDGRIVKSENPSLKNPIIEVGNLESGVYILKILNSKNSLSSIKFVKQ